MAVFRFKQLSVSNTLSAMKVNTDGVLLGAAMTIPKDAPLMLDIGTGTGTIALMAAQRAPQARVLGLDIDEESVRQAGENARRSPFSEKVEIHLCDVRDFYDSD